MNNNQNGENNPNWKGGRRINSHGYVMIKYPSHHLADKQGYVREHLLVIEEILGRPLPPGAVVHHVNGIPHDNRPRNLVVCQDNNYHKLIHQRQRAYNACGHSNWAKCFICHKYGNPKLMIEKKQYYRHIKCYTYIMKNIKS